MKKSFNYILKGMLLVTALAFSSCEIEEIVDPNNPSVGSAIGNASFAEMQFLITGLESRHRSYFGNAAQRTKPSTDNYGCCVWWWWWLLRSQRCCC